ncbi:expressed unknown protein [Seminavis robusta]|uniref:Uncharacterized protein n=1 Tax=Seminavis robusta TaxID=568900 RepID=A0A9N8HLZ1_9STRA|nr:expressed unknown protein [Seminavis robusta]|eukprot:Sro854_g211290.1 n/a (280) ;mRNA; r:37764-38603
MKLAKTFLLSLLSVFVLGQCKGAGVRALADGTPSASAKDADNRRRLFVPFFSPVTINDIIEQFIPTLNALIQSTLASNLDNVNLGIDFSQFLAGLDVAVNCTADGTVQYNLGSLTGLGSFQIESLELVPGTESLELSFMGLSGASWSGTWNIKGVFGEAIGAVSEVVLSADACGLPLQETAKGMTSVANPGIDIRVSMNGSSPNLWSLASSFIESISVDSANLFFDSIVANIDGLFGNGLELDLSTIFDGLLSDVLLNQLLPLLVNLLQSVLSGGLNLN